MTKEKLFTQSEVDAIVRERLDRERKRNTGDEGIIESLRNELTSVRGELESIKADNVAKEQALKVEQVNKTIIRELEKVNGINPTELSKLFVGGASMNDNGEVVYTDDTTGDTVPMAEHIQAWGELNPWAIKNIQTPGSGAGAGDIGIGRSTTALRDAFNLD